MDSEFYNLYNTVCSFEKSIMKNLRKIDEELLQAVNDYGSTSALRECKEYKISVAMLGVLENYNKMNFLAKTAMKELRTKLAEIHRDSAPEREVARSPNPFAITATILGQVKLETEASNEDNLLSDANTVRPTDLMKSPISESPLLLETKLEAEISEDSSVSDTDTIKAADFMEPSTSGRGAFVSHSTTRVTFDAESSEDSSGSDIETIMGADEGPQNVSEPEYTILQNEPEGSPPVPEVSLQVPEASLQVPEASLQVPEASLQVPEVSTQVPEVNISKSSQSCEEPAKLKEALKSKFTALTKLLNMNVYDRRKEAERMYDEKYMDKTELKWTVEPKSPKTEKNKKTRGKPIIYDIQDDVLVANETCRCIHVESPSEFYIRTNQELFESLEASLNDDLNEQYQYVKSNFKSKEEARSIVGNFAFWYYPDDRKWYRVEVLDWMEDLSDTILVQWIDYGPKFYTRYENLKCMWQLYSAFPKMAIRCHLAFLLPPVGPQWPQGTIDVFSKLSEVEEMSEFVVIYAHKEKNSYSIDLARSRDEKTVSQILIDCDLARSVEIPTEDKDESDVTRRDNTPTKDKELEIVFEEEEEEYDNINEAVAGYDAQDEARICPFTDNSGRCFKGPSCKLEHAKLSEDGITTDKTLTVFQALTELPLPGKGDVIQIIVTGYKSVSHFYAQILTVRGSSGCYSEEYDRIMEIINSNNLVATYTPFKVFPGIGEILLVKHDNRWHRAKCTRINTDYVTVFLVDTGKIFNKRMSDLRQIKEDFLYIPFQAVEFVIDDVAELRDLPTERSWGFYEKLLALKEFKAEVMGNTDPVRIKMYDGRGDDQWVDMSYVLKTFGLVQDCPSVYSEDNLITLA